MNNRLCAICVLSLSEYLQKTPPEGNTRVTAMQQ